MVDFGQEKTSGRSSGKVTGHHELDVVKVVLVRSSSGTLQFGLPWLEQTKGKRCCERELPNDFNG